jgi:hypothetical protein
VRPSKPSQSSSEKVPVTERAVENDIPQQKAKPPVPARPAGSKIAALQAGFLQDLNSKLGLGPQAPKVKEPEEEKEPEPAQPLSDARKGRAKGPQRRKPAASPAPAATVTAEVAVPRAKLEIAPVTAIWGFGEDGALDVPAARVAAQIQRTLDSHKPAQETKAPSATKDFDVSEESDAPKASGTSVEDTVKSIAAPVVEAARSIASTETATSSDAPVKDEPSLLSKIADALPSLTSQEEPAKDTPALSEAPGAFPAVSGEKTQSLAETKDSEPTEEASPLPKMDSLPSTQPQGATEEAPIAMRESVADA